MIRRRISSVLLSSGRSIDGGFEVASGGVLVPGWGRVSIVLKTVNAIQEILNSIPRQRNEMNCTTHRVMILGEIDDDI